MIQNKIKIDDIDLYNCYFDNLSKYLSKNNNLENKKTDGAIIQTAIRQTLQDYFGPITAGKNKRTQLTSMSYDAESDTFVIPSLKVLKKQNAALCVERASVAHNLWLLAGKQSYFINTSDTIFSNVGSDYKNDGHAFGIIEYDGVFRLIDYIMDNFAKLDNPIEKIEKGEYLEINDCKNPGIYCSTHYNSYELKKSQTNQSL